MATLKEAKLFRIMFLYYNQLLQTKSKDIQKHLELYTCLVERQILI